MILPAVTRVASHLLEPATVYLMIPKCPYPKTIRHR